MRFAKKMLTMVLLCTFCLMAGCKEAPDNFETTQSDNEITIQGTDTESNTDISQENNAVFTSTDGSVDFRISENMTLPESAMPVVEIAPHYITGSDARNVVNALFGEAEAYEADSIMFSAYSKSELQERSSRWMPYTSQEAVQELFGEGHEYVADTVKVFIEGNTELYNTAPDQRDRIPCQWEFHKEGYYWTDPVIYNEADYANDNDQLDVQLIMNGIPYRCQFITRNEADFKLNMISVFPYDGMSPEMIDDRIFRAELCRTKKPTEVQMAEIQAKAETIADNLGMGEWVVDQTKLETLYFGDIAEYAVQVHFVPMLENTPVLWAPQLNDLTNKEAYASNYYLSELEIEMSADGRLITLNLMSPVEQVSVPKSAAELMPEAELMAEIRNWLSLSDAFYYGGGDLIAVAQEPLNCNVTVTALKQGLVRIRVPESDDHYQYIPGVAVYGNVEYVGAESDSVHFSNENTLLLRLNALDGGVLQQ